VLHYHLNFIRARYSVFESVVVGFLVNTDIMHPTCIRLEAFIDKGVVRATVPSLLIAMIGVCENWLTALISLCIVW